MESQRATDLHAKVGFLDLSTCISILSDLYTCGQWKEPAVCNASCESLGVLKKTRTCKSKDDNVSTENAKTEEILGACNGPECPVSPKLPWPEVAMAAVGSVLVLALLICLILVFRKRYSLFLLWKPIFQKKMAKFKNDS